MLTNNQANAILDLLLGTPGQLPGTVYIGLMTAAPNPDGSGVVEPSGGSYIRVAVTNNSTQWPAASSRQKTHANDIAFTAATAGWGTITYVGIFDTASGGDLHAYGPLDTPRVIATGDQFTLQASIHPLIVTL